MSRSRISSSSRRSVSTRSTTEHTKSSARAITFIEGDEGDLGLDHPELGQVAAGLALFRAEGRAEAVDLAVSHGGRLEIELARLGKVDRLAEVIDLEEGLAPSPADGVRMGVSIRMKPRLSKNPRMALMIVWRMRMRADGRLRPQVQVAVAHEEVDAVRLGGDRVVDAGARSAGH